MQKLAALVPIICLRCSQNTLVPDPRNDQSHNATCDAVGDMRQLLQIHDPADVQLQLAHVRRRGVLASERHIQQQIAVPVEDHQPRRRGSRGAGRARTRLVDD